MSAQCKCVVAVALIGAAALGSTEAHAQNYREMPIGGRTATMGGAGTAAGNDSAMPYLNPAGLAGVPGDIFAVSATVYSYTHRSFQNYFYPQGTNPLFGYQKDNENFSTSSIGELPTSVMYFRHLSKPDDAIQHKIGISLVIPTARNVEVVASVSGRATENAGTFLRTGAIAAQQRRYYIGPTYAAAIGANVRVGASLYGLYSRDAITIAEAGSDTFLGGAGEVNASAQNARVAESFSLAPIVGAQVRVVSDLWAGIGVAAPSLPLTGRIRGTEEAGLFNSRTGRPIRVVSTYDADYQSATPLRLNAGVAWDRREGFSAAADLHLYIAREETRTDGSSLIEQRVAGEVARRYVAPITQRTQAHPVVDVSIGAEYAFTKMLAGRAGFFTDVASSSEIGEGPADMRRIRLNRFGGTLGVGLKIGSFDTTTGVLLVRGNGKFGVVDGTGKLIANDTTETTGMLVLSGAVTIEEAKKTIQGALPVQNIPLPDLELGSASGKAPAPWIPAPLPAEPKPAPPTLNRGPTTPATMPAPTPPAPPTPPTPPGRLPQLPQGKQ